MATSSRLVIEQQGVARPLRVELADDDLPEGRLFQNAAWEEGGEWSLGDPDGTYFPGRTDPIYHPNQIRYTPRTLKGLLCDRYHGEIGYARRKRDEIKRIWQAATIIRVEWNFTTTGDADADDPPQSDSDGFTGFFKGAKFPVHSDDEIGYELTFLVAEEDGFGESRQPEKSHTSAGADLAGQMRDDMATTRAEQEALIVKSAILSTVGAHWNAIDDALKATEDALGVLESGTVGRGRQAESALQRVVSGARDVQARIDEFVTDLDALTVETTRDAVDASSRGAWEANRLALFDSMRRWRDDCWAIARQAREQTEAATRLYLVREGDTIADVARQAFGAAGRDAELGITQADLEAAVGRYLRIPKVA